MSDELRALLEKVRGIKITPEDEATQRLKFAYANSHFEDNRISWETMVRLSKEPSLLELSR